LDRELEGRRMQERLERATGDGAAALERRLRETAEQLDADAPSGSDR
jgi:hypothetical protein